MSSLPRATGGTRQAMVFWAQRLRGSLKSGGLKDSGKFREMKARLRKLPPAKSMSR